MATLIRYKANGSKRRVADFVAKRLVSRGIAEYAEGDAVKTVFTFKNGKTRTLKPKGTYETRELRADDPAFPCTPDTRTIAEVDAQIKADNAEIAAEQEAQEIDAQDPEVESDELDGLSVEELRELANERGVNVHHRAGADKIRAALRGDGDE